MTSSNIKLSILGLIVVMSLTGCFNKTSDSNSNASNNPTTNKQMTKAKIETNKGDIVIELFDQQAPNTVANFIRLAQMPSDSPDGQGLFYDNIKFHRVIPDFMIQTGDPQSRGEAGVDFVYDPANNPKNLPIAGTGGPGYTFADEFSPDLRFDKPGVVAMANSGANTNGSQFFITHVPTQWLNDKHTIFGQVLEGQDVVNSIQQGDYIKTITIIN